MKKLLLLLLVLPLTFYSQTQIGQDIDGEMAGDKSGSSISLSSDGSIIAIGARYNDGNGLDSGHVRVYENISGSWTQIGQDIDGEAINDASGVSVCLSSNGYIVAIGAHQNDGNGSISGHVRVYENISGVWTQIGQDIDGEAVGDASGLGLSLSSDGSIVAIGAFGNDGNGSNSGHVRVYKNVSGVWMQLGQDIDGKAAEDRLGTRLSLSSDGNTLAIGASLNQGNGANSGHVRVYEYILGVWTQLGSDIYGEAAEDRLVNSSLSSNGNILAVASNSNDGNGLDSGHARVYENISGVWTQLGSDIDGEASGDNAGRISLSSDGDIIAIGAIYNDGNGMDSGHVRVYKNISGVWTQIGSDIDGEAANDNSGYVSLSSNGSILAIGAPLNDGNGMDSGHVRVYDLSTILSTESFKQNYFSFYPNPVKDELNIKLNKGLELNKINIYNIQSQYLYSTKALKIDTKNLASGIYFIEVETNKGKSAKKIIKK